MNLKMMTWNHRNVIQQCCRLFLLIEYWLCFNNQNLHLRLVEIINQFLLAIQNNDSCIRVILRVTNTIHITISIYIAITTTGTIYITMTTTVTIYIIMTTTITISPSASLS